MPTKGDNNIFYYIKKKNKKREYLFPPLRVVGFGFGFGRFGLRGLTPIHSSIVHKSGRKYFFQPVDFACYRRRVVLHSFLSVAIQRRPTENDDMKTTAFKGDITTAYGKKLSKALSYSGSFEAYETVAEIREEKDFPTDKEIVDFRNAERKANAVSQERNKVLEAAGIEKPQPKDPVVVYANFVKQLRLSGKSQKAADTMAVDILGYNAEGYIVRDGTVTDEKAVPAEESADADE